MSLTTLLISSGMQAFFSYHDRQNIIIDQQYSIAQKAADEVRKFIDAKSSLLYAKGQELEIASRLSKSASGNLTGRTGSDMLSLVGMGRKYISPVYIDEVTSEPMIIMAVPATDVFGDFKGLLIAEVNLKFMWDMIDRMKIGESGTAYVVDRQGTLMAYSDISLVLKGEKLIRLKEVRDFVENPGLLTEKDAEFAGYISKRITKPIMLLNNAANEIGKGNFNPVIEVGPNDEIGQLASALNTMTGELKKQQFQKMEEKYPFYYRCRICMMMKETNLELYA